MRVEIRRDYEFPLDEPVNYYIIPEYRVMIDAGIQPPESGYDFIYVTHWHWDHVIGIASIKDKTVCMHKSTINIFNNKRYADRVREILRAGGISFDELNKYIINFMNQKYEKLTEGFSKNHIVPLEECPHIKSGIIKYIECPGHSIDHVCYIINNTIFVGDTLLPSRRTTIINFRRHRESIIKILEHEWKILYPGHGEPLTREHATSIAKNYVINRCNRLYHILKLLALRGSTTIADLVREIYGKQPDPASFILVRTLIGYLAELEEIGIVRVNRNASPWRVELIDDSYFTSSSY